MLLYEFCSQKNESIEYITLIVELFPNVYKTKAHNKIKLSYAEQRKVIFLYI